MVQPQLHILLVDDEPSIQAITKLVLKGSGFTVSLANNGSEAIQILAEQQEKGNPVDLLITDICMPDMSGLELVQQLAHLGVDLPMLVISGLLEEVSLETLRQIKRHKFLAKPFTPQELLWQINDLTAAADNQHGNALHSPWEKF